jgi:hypothetical protein
LQWGWCGAFRTVRPGVESKQELVQLDIGNFNKPFPEDAGNLGQRREKSVKNPQKRLKFFFKLLFYLEFL